MNIRILKGLAKDSSIKAAEERRARPKAEEILRDDDRHARCDVDEVNDMGEVFQWRDPFPVEDVETHRADVVPLDYVESDLRIVSIDLARGPDFGEVDYPLGPRLSQVSPNVEEISDGIRAQVRAQILRAESHRNINRIIQDMVSVDYSDLERRMIVMMTPAAKINFGIQAQSCDEDILANMCKPPKSTD